MSARAHNPAGRCGAPPSLLSTAIATLVLSLPAVLLHLSAAATDSLVYLRDTMATQPWRVITSHWTHWSYDHLRWDLLAFAVLVPLCWRMRPSRTIAALATSAVLIPIAVWLFIPQMVEYRGLSGLDSALFVLLGVSLLRQELTTGSKACAAVFALALAAFAGKIGYELLSSSTLFATGTGFVPVPLAHVVGGVCGAFFAVVQSKKIASVPACLHCRFVSRNRKTHAPT